MKVGILSGGRCLLGFGRGAASVEYAGLPIPMEEARPRFVETAEILVKALSQDVFVMPVPQRDPAFAWPGAPTPGAAPLPASAPTVSSPRPDRARHHLMEGHRDRRLASRCRRLTRSRETTL